MPSKVDPVSMYVQRTVNGDTPISTLHNVWLRPVVDGGVQKRVL